MTVQWNGDLVSRALAAAAERAAEQAARMVYVDAQTRVPVEDGKLGRSAKVTSDGPTAAVSYNTEYAVAQHENLRLAHDAGREGKWLENAGNRQAARIRRSVAAELRRALGT